MGVGSTKFLYMKQKSLYSVFNEHIRAFSTTRAIPISGHISRKLHIYMIHMGVSKYRGTPKSSILIGFSIIFTIHFGGPPQHFWKHPYKLNWIDSLHAKKMGLAT